VLEGDSTRTPLHSQNPSTACRCEGFSLPPDRASGNYREIGMAKLNLAGQRCGQLTILRPHEKDKWGYILWECVCDCGRVVIGRGAHLKQGQPFSCGCAVRKKEDGSEGRTRNSRGQFKGGRYPNPNFGTLLTDYKKGARSRDLAWALSDAQVAALFSQQCAYCGALPNRVCARRSETAPFVWNGIDRLDSSIGYTESNCVACCWECNRMKSSMTYRDFIEHVDRIHKNVRRIP